MNPATQSKSRRPSLLPLVRFAGDITAELPPSDARDSLRAVIHAIEVLVNQDTAQPDLPSLRPGIEFPRL